jgi:hypothetical protein
VSIKYIKENLKKFDHDNLISFLFDIVIRGGIDNVYDFDETKEYVENEKVYFKDSKNNHHIYKCVVEKSTVGQLMPDEWLDLLQSFRQPVITEETLVTQLDITEEVIKSDIPNQTTFRLTTAGVEDGDYTVVVFHPEFGRLARTDFELNGKNIILNNMYKVSNVGDKLIVDLYRNN